MGIDLVTFTQMSINEYIVFVAYFALWFGLAVSYSKSEYAAIGRPSSYLIGHLCSLHYLVTGIDFVQVSD